MNVNQDLAELAARLYVRRDEIAAAHQAASPTNDCRHVPGELEQMDRALQSLSSGLHPVCDTCGDRIEIERLQAAPFAMLCGRCAARELKTP